MHELRRILVITLVVACTKPVPAEPTPAEPTPAEPTLCPVRDGVSSPLLPPGATPLAGRGMATTINPGMNSSEEHYRIEGMSVREASDFYRRCLPRSDDASSTFEEPVQGGDAGPGANRSYVVGRDEGVTVVRVRCSRCY
jgi:hypothetical protein